MTEQLRRMRDELQNTIEELQTSNEELKASHEEVVSTNEELQSTNEELETSREEMQSLNEELSTVNSQLQAKIEEHQAAHNDLAGLLASTDIAVLFLDRQLRIRRFTPPVLELLDMIVTDVGRPLSDLARKFTDPSLAADAEAVLMKLVPVEREIAGEDGRWFLRRVTPYRTTDNRIDGVVITFVDISARRRAEEERRRSDEQFRRAIEDAPIAVIMQAEDGEVLQVSRTWTALTGYALTNMPTVDAWLNHAYGDGPSNVREHVREMFKGSRFSLNVEFGIHAGPGMDRRISFSAAPPGMLGDGRRFIVGMAVDITDRHKAEAALRESEERYRNLFNSIDEAFAVKEAITDATGSIVDFRYVEVNPAFSRHTGITEPAGRTVRELMPDIQPFWIKNFAQVLRTGKPMRIPGSRGSAESLARRLHFAAWENWNAERSRFCSPTSPAPRAPNRPWARARNDLGFWSKAQRFRHDYAGSDRTDHRLERGRRAPDGIHPGRGGRAGYRHDLHPRRPGHRCLAAGDRTGHCRGPGRG